MLLSEAISALLIATKADGQSPETVTAYRRKLKPLVVFLGDVQVESISVDDLRRYVASMRDEATLYADHPYHEPRAGTLSPFTVAGRVRALKRLFSFLEAEGVITVNSARKIKTRGPGAMNPRRAAWQTSGHCCILLRGEA